MKSLLTPKELAEAIGASESSLRRWVDGGDIRMSRTAGGHRRIPLAEAVRFVRAIGATVIRPDILGLGSIAATTPQGLELSDDERLYETLRAGEGDVARRLIVSWYLAGRGLAELFDGPVRSALHRLGELWKHDDRGILIEHRATAICAEAITTLRGLLPSAAESAPLALGGAPEGDPYQIPSMMAAAVLADVGYRETNFGANTPVEGLAREAVERGARMVWLSVSTSPDPRVLVAGTRKLAEILSPHHITLAVGGRHGVECAPSGLANVRVVGSMGELATFARDLHVNPPSSAITV